MASSRPRIRLLALLLMVLACVGQWSYGVEGWGADGHHATCLLAEPLLEPATVDAVRSLLPDYADGSLASLCTWADDIRWQYKWHWTSALHFIDTPDFLCRYNYDRDCHNSYGDVDMCVSGAIYNYTSQLTSYRNSAHSISDPAMLEATARDQYNLTEALLFLAHFVGDVHQPLHVGFTSDAGGNTILVHWYRRKYNLHHIWDNEIINKAKTYYYNSNLQDMIDAIFTNITGDWVEQAKVWGECANDDISCPDIYATESINLACKWAYKNATPGSTLSDDYFFSRLPIVQKRLAQGGVRLAAILNRIFSPSKL
ncbi:unnamed protein product [Sphagnum troendelagicum]|uniref:Aspergillus nuclease S1 n=1 Tax=Sphagnum troendelagicum TaxID=128251 RepID=A0ABP0U7Y4_9BRYO